MPFVEILNQTIDPILEKIVQHQFLQKLTVGTLEREIYHAYLEQDYYYLIEYTQSLLKISEQAI